MKFLGQIIFIWIVSLAFLPHPGYAASFDLDLRMLQAQSTCPTVLKDTPPLDKSSIPLYLRNQLDKGDTYSLSLSLPSGWSGFIEPEIYVPSLETRQVEAIWVTVPEVQPGLYTISVSAASGLTKETMTKTFGINVLACRGVTVVIADGQKDVCSEKPEATSFAAEVKNIGKSADTFDLFVTKGGQTVSYATINTPSISLNAGESRTAAVFLTPPRDLLGKQEFVLSARSRSTLTTTSSPFSISLKDCYSFIADIAPTGAKMCLGDSANFTLELSNVGLEDTYSITSEQTFVRPDKSSLKLSGGQKGQAKISAAPVSTGKQAFSIQITPASSVSERKTLNLNLDVDDCRGIAVVMSPVQSTVCSSTSITYDVIVKNIGAVEETVEINADMGSLEQNKLTVKPKEAKSVKLNVNANFTGERIVNVAAKTGSISDKTISLLTAENCFASELAVRPEKVEACACDTVNVSLLLANKGKVADEYDVQLEGTEAKKKVRLDAGKSEAINYPITVPCSAKSETKTLEAVAESKSAKTSAKGSLVVRETSACFSSSVSLSSPAVNVEPLKSAAFPVKIKNTGLKRSNFSIEVDGPDWLYFVVKSLTLDSGQESTAYLYASPPYGVSEARYSAKITAKSDYSQSSATVTLNVGQVPSPAASPKASPPLFTPTPAATAALSPKPSPAPTAATAPSPALSPTPAIAPGAKTVSVQFVNHIEAGMPEQDVFIEPYKGSRTVVRAEANDTRNASILMKDAYATATYTAHDPFKLGIKPLGPFAKGAPLGFRLGEWLAAEGSGTYTAEGDTALVNLTFQKLVPNGTYTAWCSSITFPPDVRIVDRPCGASDGSQNSFKAGPEGNGAFNLKAKPLEESTKEKATVIAIAYHSDGRTFGAYPGAFGLNSHVQLFFMMPVPAAPTPTASAPTTVPTQIIPSAAASPASNISTLAPVPAKKNVSFNASLNETGQAIRQEGAKAIAIGVIAFIIVAVLVIRFLTLTK
ncbi:MAG: hypothetical protein HYX24_01260 [Candidatus Aenigmarchaeota archaeon]|nr:hypothetical protein [Candidatus Aenigmarchaeota archaeon]